MSRQTLSGLVHFIWSHPANRGHRLRALLRAGGWQLWKRITGRPWDVGMAGALRLRCYPDSTSASLALYCRGFPDYAEMTFMNRYLRPGDRFLDVGANVGVYSLLAAGLVGPGGAVEAVEPDPKAALRLRENVALNGLGQVHIHEVAVADLAGKVEFLQGRDTQNRIRPAGDEGSAAALVPCVRLDDMIRGHRFSMGKMDIEGAEPLALQGASEALALQNPAVWLLEMTGLIRSYGFTEEQFTAWLDDRGYELAAYDADNHVLHFSDRAWLGRSNVFAVARACRSQVEERLALRSAMSQPSPRASTA